MRTSCPFHGVNKIYMKKTNRKASDGLRAEYDFKSMPNGIRGKYAACVQAESRTNKGSARRKVSTRKSHP
jgi:hypothetical protein